MEELDDIKTNKLNVYLIKEAYEDENSIIDRESGAIPIRLDGIGTLYYSQSVLSKPTWIESFFRNHEAIRPEYFSVSGARAVLITTIEHRGKKRFFAIPFGSGRFFLNDYCWEERFGLITSLNILEANKIRALDKRTLSTNPKMSREQISKASEAVDFQIDYERDLIQAITGQSTDPMFGKIVTGKESISVSSKIDVRNLKGVLEHYIEHFYKSDYKTNFGWVDQIMEVKTPEVLNKLNSELLKGINEENELIWLAVPEIIDWTGVKGFKYSTAERDILHDELLISDLLNDWTIPVDTEIAELKSLPVTAWGEDGYLYKWSLFSCLNAEIDLDTKKYFLSNGKWYEIEESFVKQVNDEFNKIERSKIALPEYDHEDENDYNVHAAKTIDGLCLDAQNIPYGGGHSKIEFCDILTKDKKLIHVKKYGGSAVLSHLFAQGSVSAQLLLMDIDFRKKVIDKLKPGYLRTISEERPKASDYTVVYAIVSSSKRAFTIPFFSKVTLKNSRNTLEGFGFKVCLQKVQNVKTITEEEE